MRRLLAFNIDDVSARTAFIVNLLITLALFGWCYVAATYVIMDGPTFLAGLLVALSPWIVSAWSDTRIVK